MSHAHARRKALFAKTELPGKIRPEQSEILVAVAANAHGQHGREADNIVAPEHAFDFRQIGFVQVGAVARRLKVYPADLNVKSIFLRGYDQVCAVGAQFTANLVANIGGDRDHGRGYSDAQRDRDAGKCFPPLLSPERFVNQASEHAYCWNNGARAAMSAS